jgi:lipopolysaccharide export system permease protein
VLFSALILWMYHVAAHRPGGQPIGALEAVFAKISKWMGKWLRLGRRKLRHAL